MMSVPTIALPNPPPCSSAVGGSCVNTVRLSFLPPRHKSIRTTENSGMSEKSVMAVTIALNRKSVSVRGRLRDRSRCEKSTPANGSRASMAVVAAGGFMERLTSIRVDDRCALDHERAEYVHHQRDREEDERCVHQHAYLSRACFREIVREKCRQRICRR